MTLEELQGLVSVEKIIPGEGFNYAEHGEEDPDVYARMTDKHERIEYYFYKGRLYKIFIIYDRILSHTPLYEKLVEDVTREFGQPDRTYQEEFFGLRIDHSLWEDNISILDLRKGAGFIFQVRMDKETSKKKERALNKRKAI